MSIRYVIYYAIASLYEVFAYIWTYFILRRGISYPGDAIKDPQKRKGKWSNTSEFIQAGWSFVSDKSSYDYSQDAFKVPMTGKPHGRLIWVHQQTKSSGTNETFCPAKNPNSSDKIFRAKQEKTWNIDIDEAAPDSPMDTAKKGIAYYQMLQCDDGYWAGDYGGPMFLMPGLICALYITKAPFPSGRREAMMAYIRNHQQLDGGWGTHIECASTMFGTVLNYVALRLLGESRESARMVAAREFMNSHGGALFAPSWAKFWLAVLGIYEWDGINSIPAEMWFLPRWFPFHPGNLWCHCRMIYLPMSYLYCKRFTPDINSDPLLLSLREEIYVQKYADIDWNAHRQACAAIDEYSPLNPILRLGQDFLSVYEKWLPNVPILCKLRASAVQFVMSYIQEEDKQTNYINIGPVSKAFNMLAAWVEGGQKSDNVEFVKHLSRVDDYLWVAEDGMKMQGYNGSQCWDTAFAAQAILETGCAEEFGPVLKRALNYFDVCQIDKNEENRSKFFRHVSKGGWPFSTAAHGWPISDCTSEGLKSVIMIQKALNMNVISQERLMDACNVILSLQNTDGGWSSYEPNRGYRWYEMLNPSEVFGDIIIDYSYAECSSASMSALKLFKETFPGQRTNEINNAIEAGKLFLKSIQRSDGSWYGSWGNCFTYGTWFGIEGLVTAGESVDSEVITLATEFLLSKQNPNGGWGECYLACVNKAYPPDGSGEGLGEDGSAIVQTSWALLALMAAKSSDRKAIERGIAFIRAKQLPSGDWPQEGLTGVFARSCGITYTAYRNVFPIWAIARYGVHYDRQT